MGLKKTVIVLCWWACVGILLSFNNFSLCLLRSSKKSPKHCWSSYSITLHSGPKLLLKVAMVSHYYFIKNTTVTDVFFKLHFLMTIGKFILLEVSMHICLPQSLTDVMKFTAALSHYAEHRIDLCPYKVAWWRSHPPMCVKCVFCSGTSSYQVIIWGWSMLSCFLS